jgi:hypothetical protein
VATSVQTSSSSNRIDLRNALRGCTLVLFAILAALFLLPAPLRASVEKLDEAAFSTGGFHLVAPSTTLAADWLGLNILRYRITAKHVYVGDSGEDDARLYVRSWLPPGALHDDVFIEGMCGTALSGCWQPPGGPVSGQFPGRRSNLLVWAAPNGHMRVRLLPWSRQSGRPYGYAIHVGWQWDAWLAAWAAALAALVVGLRLIIRAVLAK